MIFVSIVSQIVQRHVRVIHIEFIDEWLHFCADLTKLLHQVLLKAMPHSGL